MDDRTLLKVAAEMLEQRTPVLSAEDLRSFVATFLESRMRLIYAADHFGSPLYIIDDDVLASNASSFQTAFERSLSRVDFYYAVKSNNHPYIAQSLTRQGFGLDVSSGVELQMALDTGAERIVFSGPGKTREELDLAIRHADRVTVHMDSFSELKRLDEAAGAAGRSIRAGVRLTTEEKGLWRKFGIPLADLHRFFEVASKADHVDLRGLQFHTSWNLTPEKPAAFLKRLGQTLSELGTDALARIDFLDIGGGYWPPQGEWLLAESTPEGRLREILSPGERLPLDHRCFASTSIEEFAQAITDTLVAHVFPHIDSAIFVEPGRWICNDAMHILLTVVDKKSEDLVITDGGTNAVGWERFETDYFPVINLTRPSEIERPCMVFGSLCTPHDVWGYAYFGSGIEPGDRLLIPTQGAYTYSLRQHFIKALPKTVAFQGKEAFPVD